jgi:hypothetical protein
MKTKDTSDNTSIELATEWANFLRETAGEIWKEKELLSFMRLHEHLHRDLFIGFRGREYILKRSTCPRASLNLSYEDRVFAIRIFDKLIDDGEGGIKINRVELLPLRGDHCISWLILKENFSKKLDLPNLLYSTDSEIIYNSSHPDLIANLADIDFNNGICDLSVAKNTMRDIVDCSVLAWIRASIEKREETLKRLRKFYKNYWHLSGIKPE